MVNLQSPNDFMHQAHANLGIGIPNVQEVAMFLYLTIEARQIKPWEHDRQPLDGIFSDAEQTELCIRELVRSYRDKKTGKVLVEDIELERVLFDVMYPLFGARQEKRYQASAGGRCLVQ